MGASFDEDGADRMRGTLGDIVTRHFAAYHRQNREMMRSMLEREQWKSFDSDLESAGLASLDRLLSWLARRRTGRGRKSFEEYMKEGGLFGNSTTTNNNNTNTNNNNTNNSNNNGGNSGGGSRQVVVVTAADLVQRAAQEMLQPPGGGGGGETSHNNNSSSINNSSSTSISGGGGGGGSGGSKRFTASTVKALQLMGTYVALLDSNSLKDPRYSIII